MSDFDTIPVPGDRLRAGDRGHLIAIDGMTATITSRIKLDNGEHVIRWQQIDHTDGQQPATGIIYLPDGATVECVRRADWLNRRDSEAAA
ncbi:hypothetical protein ABZW11_16960 [Nonomuraea sp. NPDC004580]|uniref:hypothetical protein n=1 Tax=Nonomuraea sp. NPDC004580 TaxID=3154552 RepID=UPI0033BB0F38